MAALDYGIEEAKRIRDWEALKQAVADKIEEQLKFAAWHTAHVHLGDREGHRAPGDLTNEQVENLTGMKQQLGDRDKALRGASSER